MKISYNWLKKYLDFTLPPEEISKRLTACGLEVENLEKFESVPGGFENIVIGKVLSCQPHPNADRLSVTTVDVGEEEALPIVCGAPNVAAGQTVVVAKVGATVRFGEEEVVLKKTKIRGEASEGMICAEDELGLGTSHAGILVINEAVAIGTPAKSYFGIETDYIFEIGLTPNRSDAASHLGVARDLAAVFANEALIKGGKVPMLKMPDISAFTQDDASLPIDVIVEDTNACPRYSGVTMRGLKVEESPQWLKDKLIAIGLRPINNLVDISNYVLMETGQPLHFFDASKIKGGKIIIKQLPEQTPFVTLDEIERKLSAEDLMICNAEEGMCIAGVFGGISSGVKAETTSIFIESACFDPVSIRKSSKRHGLKTDASFRFERGTDPEMTLYALKRAVGLIKEIAGGNVSSGLYDIYPSPSKPVQLYLALKRVDMLIGKNIPEEQILGILASLDIRVLNKKEDILEIEIPLYRVDVKREADVIEEILRIYGYNNVEVPERLMSALSYSPKPDKDSLRNQVANMLVGQAWSEAMCNSLSNSVYYSWQEDWKAENSVRILNPVSQDLDVMRQTLLFGGLETLRYNRNRRQIDVRTFEFGNIYRTDGSRPTIDNTLGPYTENNALLLILSGKANQESWNSPAREADFFELKSAVENVFLKLGLGQYTYAATKRNTLTEGLAIHMNGKEVTWLGQLKSSLLQKFDIDADAFAAEINWDALMDQVLKTRMQFKSIPKYPEVRRDLALVIDQNISFQALYDTAFAAERKLLKSIRLFDVYEGKGVESGKKSYAISFVLQDEEKTLTDKVIDKVMGRIQAALEKEYGAKLR